MPATNGGVSPNAAFLRSSMLRASFPLSAIALESARRGRESASKALLSTIHRVLVYKIIRYSRMLDGTVYGVHTIVTRGPYVIEIVAPGGGEAGPTPGLTPYCRRSTGFSRPGGWGLTSSSALQ